MSGHTPARSEARERWDEAADVVVVGYGYAGAVAAIEAHDAGADVLLIEKMPDPGGISITSGGNVRIVEDAEEGFRHLQATNAATTPDPVLRALAAGMADIPAYFEKLARVSGATINRRQADGNYPFPGTKTFGYVSIDHVPGFDAERTYPFVSSYVPIHRAAGVRLFKVLEDNVSSRRLRIALSTAAARLITGVQGEICGVVAQRDGRVLAIKARRAVVLACGGFEANPDMQRQYWQEKPVLNAAYMGNTGDGILMAQAVGAALWHMWHYHGVYGFQAPRSRLSLWYPAEAAAGLDSGRECARRRQGAVDHRRSSRPPVHERVPALHPGYDLARDGGLRWSIHDLSAHSILHDHGRARTRRLPHCFADLQRSPV